MSSSIPTSSSTTTTANLSNNELNLKAELLRLGIIDKEENAELDLLKEAVELSKDKEGLKVPLMNGKEVVAYGTERNPVEIYRWFLKVKRDEQKTKDEFQQKIQHEIIINQINSANLAKRGYRTYSDDDIRDNPYSCQFCSARFKDEKSVKLHRMNHSTMAM